MLCVMVVIKNWVIAVHTNYSFLNLISLYKEYLFAENGFYSTCAGLPKSIYLNKKFLYFFCWNDLNAFNFIQLFSLKYWPQRRENTCYKSKPTERSNQQSVITIIILFYAALLNILHLFRHFTISIICFFTFDANRARNLLFWNLQLDLRLHSTGTLPHC